MFKQYKILKEIMLKTEEVNKLMKNLYRHEGEYLEALYKYSNYNDKHEPYIPKEYLIIEYPKRIYVLRKIKSKGSKDIWKNIMYINLKMD